MSRRRESKAAEAVRPALKKRVAGIAFAGEAKNEAAFRKRQEDDSVQRLSSLIRAGLEGRIPVRGLKKTLEKIRSEEKIENENLDGVISELDSLKLK